MPVKTGVRWWNVLAIPLVPCTIMLLTTYVNAQTIFLLRDEEFFNVSEDKIGRTTSLLVMSGLPGAAIGTFTAGYLFDIMGRRLTLFLSFFISACFVLAIPYTSPSVFPLLLIVRILFQMVLSMSSANPLPADYVHKEALGKAAAFIGLGFVIGEVLSMGVLFNVTKNMTAYNAFMTASITGACFALLFLFLVKEPKLR